MDHLKDELLNRGLWDANDIKVYDKVRRQIVAELEKHQSKPSLLHGDLWGGNYMFLQDGRLALFDPAPLYGDREFDIGITTVFGGFTSKFMMRIINIIHSKKVHPIDLNFIVYIY